jgi:hypothetical protein
MTGRTEQFRAITLAALLFLSLVGMSGGVAAGGDPSGSVTFNDQELGADGTVTVEDVSAGQLSTVVITYTEGNQEIVAGFANTFGNEDVTVSIQDTGGFPGEHTAWIFDADDTHGINIGDDATPIASEALDSESAQVEQGPQGSLTFEEQILGADGAVTVDNVSTDQASTVVVTYTGGNQETIAGLANADNLDGESIEVAIEDAGGFPGEHTAWVFADEELPAGISIGDDATPVAGDALDRQSAQVDNAQGTLTFDKQALGADGAVTVDDVSTAQPSTVVVTYTEGDTEIIAGLANADTLNDEDVEVTIEDAGGFPGEHTAWVFADEDLPSGIAIGDNAVPVADRALDNDIAQVNEAGGALDFEDQVLGADGAVSVTHVETTQPSTVVVTYTEGDTEIIAGLASADNRNDETVEVAIEDAGGFPGEHTAWVFADEDLPAGIAIGDNAVPVADRALDNENAQIDTAAGELTFEAQELGEDGAVTVDNVTTDQNSTVVVTYAEGDTEIIAGLANADTLDDESVDVTIEDAGGFPGEHTAWVFADEDLPSGIEIGDNAVPVADRALDFQTAQVNEAPEGSLEFNDQELGEDGAVTVENVTTDQSSTVVVTYAEGDTEIIAGLANADNLTGANVSVTIEDAGGFPGEHTAWVFADKDLPSGIAIGDNAVPVAGEALDFETAQIDEAPQGSLAFNDQELGEDGAVTVENVSTSQASTVVVTYAEGDTEIIAGLANADTLDDESVEVTIEDAGGFPGEHTAWVFADEDLPSGIAIGDNAVPVAGEALDFETAQVDEAPEGELTFEDQVLGDDGAVTVDNVTTNKASTVVVTYAEGNKEIIAGLANADNLDDETVAVTIEDAGGFPGEHTAWVFADEDLPAGIAIGDNAVPVADRALDFETAQVDEEQIVAVEEVAIDDELLGVDSHIQGETATITATGLETQLGPAGEGGQITFEVVQDGEAETLGTATVDSNATAELTIAPVATFDRAEYDIGEKVTIRVAGADGDTAEPTLGHYVFEQAEPGYFRTSQPMPGDFLAGDGITDVAQFDTEAGFQGYDSSREVDAVDKALFVNAEEADSLYGFAFDEDRRGKQINVGDAELSQGWNVLSSNYDIQVNEKLRLEEDLGTLNEPDSNALNVYSAGPAGPNGATLSNDYQVGPFETYYVYVQTSDDRPVVLPEYTPE